MTDLAHRLLDLEVRTRELAAERDRFVSIFETIHVPTLVLEPDRSLRNLNQAASQLLFGASSSAAWQGQAQSRPAVAALTRLFPSFFLDLETFIGSGQERAEAEWPTAGEDPLRWYRAVLVRMREVPGDFDGILVTFEDLTAVRGARAEWERRLEREARTLGGVPPGPCLLPICAWCGKVRDQQGCWDPLETYIASHSEVVFSHGICPDCAAREMDSPAEPQEQARPTNAGGCPGFRET